MNGFGIHLATVEEIEEVKRLEVESNLSPWTLADYYEEIQRKDSVFVVGKKGNATVIGFGLARLVVATKDEVKACETTAFGEIYNICISKDHRNQGVGGALLKDLVDHIAQENVRTVWLDVRESNLAAISFYKKNGFEESYRRKRFYRNPSENGIVMKLCTS